jgi:hypothetical protein
MRGSGSGGWQRLDFVIGCRNGTSNSTATSSRRAVRDALQGWLHNTLTPSAIVRRTLPQPNSGGHWSTRSSFAMWLAAVPLLPPTPNIGQLLFVPCSPSSDLSSTRLSFKPIPAIAELLTFLYLTSLSPSVLWFKFDPLVQPTLYIPTMPSAVKPPQTLYDKVFEDHIVDEKEDGTILLYIGMLGTIHFMSPPLINW